MRFPPKKEVNSVPPILLSWLEVPSSLIPKELVCFLHLCIFLVSEGMNKTY